MNKSVTRTFEILQYISETSNSASISEISRDLAIPKSSVSETIHTLLEIGILQVKNTDHINQKYFELTTKLFRLSTNFLINKDAYSAVIPYLENLSHATNATAYFSIRDNDKIVYIQKKMSESRIMPKIDIGSINKLYLTSEGKAFLCNMSDSQIKDLLKDEPFSKSTDFSIDNYKDLFQNLYSSKENGFTTDIRESYDTSFGIAAPVLNYSNEVVGAISIASFYKYCDEAVVQFWGSLVHSAANDLSAELGYLGHDVLN